MRRLIEICCCLCLNLLFYENIVYSKGLFVAKYSEIEFEQPESEFEQFESALEPPEMLIMFWNLENFFDYFDNEQNDSDKEFSSFGSRHWTKKRFYNKCSLISKSIFWIADEYGRLPDVIGFAEIENKFVLKKLLDSTPLKKVGYKIVHYDSPDKRGIDVALLYRQDALELIDKGKTPVQGSRDILYARLMNKILDKEFCVVVNHHPSKYGGKTSQKRRDIAIDCLKALGDSLQGVGCDRLVFTGDFNDTPANDVYENKLTGYVNKSIELYEKGRGTIRFNGKWDLIDMFFVTPNLAAQCEMKIVEIPFLMTQDRGNSGMKPLRTYGGPKYLGGVSDHCPILLKF